MEMTIYDRKETRKLTKEARAHGFKSKDMMLLIGTKFFFHGHWDECPDDIISTGQMLSKGSESFNAYGVLYNPLDEKTYRGEWHNNILGNPNGRAVKILKDMDLYEGQLSNGQPHGHGKLTYGSSGGSEDNRYPYHSRNLDYYEGNFQNGLPHGKGKLIWRLGVEYEGTFQQGKKHGLFTLKFPTGITAEMNFDNDKPQNYRITAPESHPQKTEKFRSPEIQTLYGSSKYLLLGELKEGESILLGENGSVPDYLMINLDSTGNAAKNGIFFFPGYGHASSMTIGGFKNQQAHGTCERTEIEVIESFAQKLNGNRAKRTVEKGSFENGRLIQSTAPVLETSASTSPETFIARQFPRLDKSFEVASGKGSLVINWLFGVSKTEVGLRGAQVTRKSAILPFRTGSVTVAAQGQTHRCEKLLATQGLYDAVQAEIDRMAQEGKDEGPGGVG